MLNTVPFTIRVEALDYSISQPYVPACSRLSFAIHRADSQSEIQHQALSSIYILQHTTFVNPTTVKSQANALLCKNKA
jgi:hypothetical protein